MADKSLDRAAKNLDDTIYDHRWGFKDSRFELVPNSKSVTFTGNRYAISGTEMPEFLPFAEEILGVKVDTSKRKIDSPAPPPEPTVNEAFVEAVRETFEVEQFTFQERERLIHSHGQTTADEIYKILYGKLDRYADMVLFVETDEDVANVIKLANEHDVCLVPYGGGTSVSCALKLPAAETRMIVIVNTRRMNKILWIDRENMRVCAQAGMTGKELEEALQADGFTTGHEPDSMELSTVGGWVATNASGMKKNRYGNIEQIVENVTMVTPQGVIENLQSQPRTSLGMSIQQLLFGSEGNLGLITKVVMKVYQLPEVTKYDSIVFPNLETGVDFLYALTQKGVLPASIRLLDNVQFRFGSALKPKPSAQDKIMNRVQKTFLTKVKGFDPSELCAATVLMEGTKEEVAYQDTTLKKLAKEFGGIMGGATNGKRGYMLTYAIAYIRDFLGDYELLGETYETTVPWSEVMNVMNAVDKRAKELHAEYNLPGKPYVSPRVTQLYHTGVCIYFTHGFSIQGVERPDEVFAEIEHELRRTIIEAGGSASHHHGIGKIRHDFMQDMISPMTVDVMKEVKKAHDPNNVFGVANNVFFTG